MEFSNPEFVVLPDTPAAAATIPALLPASYRSTFPHDSGRPLVIGRWHDDDARLLTAGANRLVLFGRFELDETAVRTRLAGLRDVAGLTALLAGIPGSFHAVCSVAGVVRVQGDLAESRKIFHTAQTPSITIAADRPATLAAVTGAGVDTDTLALQLLAPYGPPWPLSGRSLWRGVSAVDGGDYLLLRPEQPARTARWWCSPEPDVPVAEAAGLLREALTDAVRSCGAPARTGAISVDLSGGMDSTSLCFLAAATGLDFSTVHYEAADPANDDRVWAAHCRPLLAAREHLVVPAADGPTLFDHLAAPHLPGAGTPGAGTPGAGNPDTEAPYGHVSPSHAARTAEHAAATGARRHLTGHGADELFRNDVTFLNAYARRHPLRSLDYLRKARANARLPLRRLLPLLRRPPGFTSWLSDAALSPPQPGRPALGWDHAAFLPPWATGDAAETVRRLLATAAEAAPEPFGATPLQHEMVRHAQSNGLTVRQSGRIAEPYGVTVEAPYLDAQVIAAAMSVRLRDRAVPGANKPTLAAAMHGIVPHGLLHRDYKGTGNADLYASLRKHRETMYRISTESELARHGLIDPERFRSVVFGVHADLTPFIPLHPTLAAEMWLRGVTAEPQPAA